ncbi:WD repeat-containing protein 59 [Blattella germanica]|nr:WD repeat-containing protein 59 [Blattella germanica]
MATRWSSEFVVAEHRDLQASAMAVDWSGVYALLAGRRYLAIKNLDDSSDTLHKIPRHSKYEVGAAEWNPSAVNKDLCAISSNQRVEILSWQTGGDLVQTQILRSHTRVVTDLNWHRFDPNLLASSSIDTFIHIWDVRDPRRPSLSLSAVAGATQVRWNRLSRYLLATAHDGDIKLWDQRKGTAPVQYIAAHLAKVSNLPFGEGLVTVVVPQLRRGENSLLLWNIANQTSPVHTFVGHTDVVLEFEWRKLKEDTLDYELITWSKDQSLRIWRIEPFLQKLCGHDRDVDNSIDTQETEDVVEHALTHPLQDLSLENGSIMSDMSNSLVLDEGTDMDAVRRSCTVTATRNAHVVILQVSFPPSYPYNAAPTFQFSQGTSIDNNTMVKLLKIAVNDESENKPFLRLHHSQPSSYLETANIYGSFQDAYIPFPRTSGAKFCSVGVLVCFGRPPFARRLSTRLESPTPRSLSALGGNLNSFNLGGSSSTNTSQYSLMYPPVAQSPTGDPNVSITSFYFQDRKQPTRTRSRGVHGSTRGSQASAKTPKKGSRAIVTIYDASSLFFIHKELGEKYVFDCHDLPGMCHRNSAVAALVGRRDLVQAWTLAALAATPSTQAPSDQDDDIPWPHHPFGKAMIESLIAHYAKQSDIQMAAMLCCTFGCRTENQETFKNRQLSKSVNVSRLATGKWWLKPGSSPYHTIHQVDTSLEGWNYHPMLKQNRSNSWSESLDEFKFTGTIVLKYMSTPAEPHKGVEFCTECQYCNKQVRSASCFNCKRLVLQCSICHVSVKGSSNFCLVCGHGGHTEHMMSWFESETVCPTGCGCSCLIETASVLEP